MNSQILSFKTGYWTCTCKIVQQEVFGNDERNMKCAVLKDGFFDGTLMSIPKWNPKAF